jgi:hypothetical protein
MKLDIQKIKDRLAKLNGEKTDKSNSQFFKPEVGTYSVRILPLDLDDDIAFTRYFYYGIGSKTMLALYQFPETKNDDVVYKFRKTLWDEREKNKDLLERLKPSMRAYLPVLVRGQEAKGVQVWGVSQTVYKKLFSWIANPKIGDFRDPVNGFDVELKVIKSTKLFKGKSFNETDVDLDRNSSKLSDDPAVVEKLLASIPNFNEMWKKPTPTELKEAFDRFMNGGGDEPDGELGEERGETKDDGLEALAKESSNPLTKVESKPAVSKKKSKKTDDDDDDLDDLDRAFDDLKK